MRNWWVSVDGVGNPTVKRLFQQTHTNLMKQYEAIDPDVEINGQTILSMIEGVSRFSDEYRQTVRDALADNGVDNPAPGEWYPQQAWLDAFGVLAESLEPHILDRIGEQIPATANWPSGISGVEDGLKSIDVAYHRNHRGGDIGTYRVTRVAEQSGEMMCRNPYPCPFDRGIIRTVARRYAPVEGFVFVEETGDECRRHGGDSCTYTVHW